MANLMKVTVDTDVNGEKRQEAIINLDQVISVNLVDTTSWKKEPHNKVYKLIISTTDDQQWHITEEPYALAVFEKMSSWARDCSWFSLVGKELETDEV